MASMLSSFFSRDPRANFAYELPATSFHTENGISMGKSWKRAAPNEQCTCFWGSLVEYGGGGSVLKAQIHKLKTIRHPNILSFIDSLETDTTVYLLTEPCLPLAVYLKENRLDDTQKELLVSWGLYQIMNALKFLHNEGKLSHESLRSAVYVTASGDWKLSAFDRSTEFKTAKTDLNALGTLVWEIFNGFGKASSTKPDPPGHMPQRLHSLYKQLATAQTSRPNVHDLINECRNTNGYMKNKFVDTLLFLDEVELKDSREKQSFFTHLKDNLEMFPSDIAKYKILPKLIHAYEYGDAGPHILIPMFNLGKLLDETEYQSRIVPCIVKLFGSPDRVTRVKLLEKIDEFAPHLTPTVINEKIYGNLAQGLGDSNPAVRESTIKAMVSLADKLNNHNLNVDLMKHLARLQGGDDQPGIRTNTTICLGKIGCYIDPKHRQRILISAFTRAMKDPFPPARAAAVLALSATQQFYSLIEVATRLIPALAPLTCDPEKQVRDHCFKSLRGFVEKLEKASENPEIISELEQQVQAGGARANDKLPQWANWALKSLSGKFYTAAPVQEPSPPPLTTTTTTTTAAAVPADKKVVEKSKETKIVDIIKNEPVDGWGELDDDDDGKTRTATTSKSEGWSDVEQEDEDDWSSDWQNAAKVVPPKTTVEKSKPVSSTTTTNTVNRSVTGGSGGLKLAPSKKQSVTDDIDALLGIADDFSRLSSSTVLGPSGPVRTTLDKKPNKTIDKVPQTTATHGWDDFCDSTNLEPKSTVTTAGWDDNEWGLSSATSSVDKRRADVAARNEQRKQELIAKKQQTTHRLGIRKEQS